MIALVYVAALLLLVGLDQWTKYLAVLHLKGQEDIILWKGVFQLEYRENRGAAFSIMQDQRWFLIGFTALALALILFFLFRMKANRRNWLLAAGTLILAGGVGNLIDRILNGFVVDFLYFSLINFPVFNVADCCVVVGSIVLMIYVLFIYREAPKSGQEEKPHDADHTPGSPSDGGDTAG